MKKQHVSFTGVVLVILGVILLLKALNVVNVPLWQWFSSYWAFGLILAGLAFVFRAKFLGVVFIVLTIIAAVSTPMLSISTGNLREFTQTVPLDDDVTTADVSIDYGAGELTIESGSNMLLVENVITTHDTDDPKVTSDTKRTHTDVTIKRKSNPQFWVGHDSSWDLKLSPEVVYNLDLDYGATKTDLDISDLLVDSLDIDSGATKTNIKFGTYPTVVDIDTGASSVNLAFPEDVGVRIDIDGGAISKDLDGFTKNNDEYTNSAYNDDGQNIEITIDAGATSITTEFY